MRLVRPGAPSGDASKLLELARRGEWGLVERIVSTMSEEELRAVLEGLGVEGRLARLVMSRLCRCE